MSFYFFALLFFFFFFPSLARVVNKTEVICINTHETTHHGGASQHVCIDTYTHTHKGEEEKKKKKKSREVCAHARTIYIHTN